MMPGETSGYEESLTDDPDNIEDSKELTEQIEIIKNQCSHVYDDPELGDMLKQLLADAAEFYHVDNRGWQELLRKTHKKILAAEDDSEKVEDVIRAALTEATTQLES